ncbi:MAG TPA: Gfo/Idh/MocA family oxidoreductase [Candidatus Paceibacterota bacterium]|jgi:predicted dehydrogenase|nr:Gfo/Idh/MocA family oxidoreductase [Candidatus Paceibacterota bacterium]
MLTLHRRDFLKTTALCTAAIAAPIPVWARVEGANDDIRVGVVGFGGRGRTHIEAFNKLGGVRVVALCDVDSRILERGVRSLSDKGQKVQGFADVRKMLESKEIDVIATATPNHWHALLTIWACQAGKDVYVEKPVSHNVFEGRKCVEAARKYNRIVQAGTQSRSNEALRQAIIWLREGHLGKIRIARGLCYKRRESIGKAEGPQSIPPEIDYDLWCGPAEKLPLARKRLHYDWHWVWNTGNGDLGNQGVHQMDIARWALGKMELSPMVFSVGGRLGYSDDGETPNTQMVVHNYGDALLIFEVRGLPAKAPEPQAGEEGKAPPMDKYRGLSVGHVIECEGGYLAGTTAFDNDHQPVKRFSGKSDDEGGHFGNFIKAVRSRKREDLKADILEGHLSSALCHTGNISHRLGRQAAPEEIREQLNEDSAALETLARMEEHLIANKVALKLTPLTIGPVLRMDPATETFRDNPHANALLTREYREPFAVPNRV